MGHIHQLRHRHLGRRHEGEGALEADLLEARQLGAPVPGSATTTAGEESGTVLSIIYVTASATFTGPVGGYTTLAVGAPVQQSATSSKHQKQSPKSNTDDTFATISSQPSSSDFSPFESQTQTPTPQSTSSALMTSSYISSATSSAVAISATSLVTSVSQSMTSQTIAGGALAAATTSSAAQASSNKVQTGMSAGAKTGLAVGILLALAMVAAGVLFLYWKKKKAVEEDEKSHNEKAAFGSEAAPMAGSPLPPAPLTTSKVAAAAPMLDLRPMSRLMPELMGQRRSQGNLLNTLNAPTTVAATGAGRSLTPPQGASLWERPANATEEKVDNPFSDPTNPFGDEQARAVSPAFNGPPAPITTATSPSMPAPLNIRSAAPAAADAGAAIAGAAIAVAAAAGATAGTAIAATAAKSTGSPASNHSATMPQGAAGAVAGSAPPPNNVHRVQLDFKPSMEDEIELQAGQLVRMLHEYDDGWALCIRLDRSQQGVAPRTCLSSMPVKPRPTNNGQRRPGPRDPRGPPFAPHGRPMTPNGGPPRPMSPARRPGSGPMVPNGGPVPRPMTPNNGPPRSGSPARGPGSRPMTPTGGPAHRFNGPPPMSPAGGSRMRAGSSAVPSSRPMSPSSAPYNQTPRPLSPGPIPGSPRTARPQQPRSMSPGPYAGGARSQQQRSMSPGPYGGGPRPGKMVAANQRRRSNSASALDVRERRNTPPGPSPLGGTAPPPGWVPPRRPIGSDTTAPMS